MCVYVCVCMSVCVYVKSLQSCPTLCDLMEYRPPGSSVHGVLQARILEWAAFASSRGSSQPMDRTQVSCIAGDSLPSEPPRKPENTELVDLALL